MTILDVTYRPATPADYDFAFSAKKQAMGSYVARQWGWNEQDQQAIHHQRWQVKNWYIIMLRNVAIGTFSMDKLENALRFGEFYIIDGFRKKGVGTFILSEFLKICDSDSKPAVLEYLKWNPVGSLYQKHGFVVTHENNVHYFMRREPVSTR